MLTAGLTAVLAVLALCGLPRLWHPLFEVDGFERATIDRFFLSLDRRDPRFALDGSARDLAALGALRVVAIGTVAG